MNKKVNIHPLDSVLEDFFVDLVVRKKMIHTELENIILIIRSSGLHSEYQKKILACLFGHQNLYIQSWGTLEESLIDTLHHAGGKRGIYFEHGIVLMMIVQIIEAIFDIHDDHMHDFVMLEERESIEYQLMITLKHIIRLLGQILEKLIGEHACLSTPPQGHMRSEYLALEKALHQMPEILLKQEEKDIEQLKQQVNRVFEKFIKPRARSRGDDFFLGES